MTIKKSRSKVRANQYIEHGIQYRGPGRFRAVIRERGVNIQKTFETLEAARDWRIVKRGEIFGEVYVDDSLPSRTTLAEACAWAIEQLGDPPYADPNDKNLKSKWRWWQQSKFAKWPLKKIDSFALIRWRRDVLAADVGDDEEDKRNAEREIGEPIPSTQTVIHRLNALSRLFQDWQAYHGVGDEVLPNPVKKGVRPGLKYRKRRRLKRGELERLLNSADTIRPWLKHAIVLAVETCARQTELAKLRWDDINLNAEHEHMILLDTKNGLDRTVPLSEPAIDAFSELRNLAEQHNRQYPSKKPWSKPIPVETGRGIIHAWRELMELIDTPPDGPIEDLTWHCLRHEGISRLFELTRMSDTQIMAITGHLGRDQLERYTHLRAQTLKSMLPTPEGAAVSEGAGSVRLRHGAPPLLRNEKGRWVPLANGDKISKVVARELLKEALSTLEEDLLVTSSAD
mgnify:CR=1 FL=1